MKKTWLLICILLVMGHVQAYPHEKQVVENARKYIGHNEALVSVTPFSFKENIYWVAEYGQKNKGEEYIVFQEKGKKIVKNQEILSAVAAAKTLKKPGQTQSLCDRPGKCMNLSKEYKNVSQKLENISQELRGLENSGGVQSQLHKLGEKNMKTSQYFLLMGMHLNASKNRFSPKDASEYLGYVEKAQKEIEKMQKQNSELIDSVKYWGIQNEYKKKAQEIEQYLSERKNRDQETSKELEQQLKKVEKHISNEVERTLCRVRSHEREILTLPVILVTLGLAIGVTFLLHLWGTRS